MCRGGGGGDLLYLLCLISNTGTVLLASIITTCYRLPATTIFYSYISSSPEKKNQAATC